MPDTSHTALVTGANRGLGFAIAARLRALGHHVIVTARDEQEAAAAAARIAPDVRSFPLDVTDQAGARSLARKLVGTVDIVVNNAGVLLDSGQAPSSIPLELVQQHLEVNLLGAWRVSQAFLPGMRTAGWGRIVMVSSGTASLTSGLYTGAPGYSLSKAALNALTVLLSAETEEDGILVNAINPGLIRTRMRPDAAGSPEAAAADVAWVATLPDGGPTGHLFRHHEIQPW